MNSPFTTSYSKKSPSIKVKSSSRILQSDSINSNPSSEFKNVFAYTHPSAKSNSLLVIIPLSQYSSLTKSPILNFGSFFSFKISSFFISTKIPWLIALSMSFSSTDNIFESPALFTISISINPAPPRTMQWNYASF